MEGSALARRAFYQEHRDRILHFASHTVPTQAAEDIAQTAWMAFYRQYDTIMADAKIHGPQYPLNLLYKITHDRVVDWLRKASNRWETCSGEDLLRECQDKHLAASMADRLGIDADRRIDVQRALAQVLDERERKVVFLHVHCDVKIEQGKEILGLPRSTYLNVLNSAKKKLRNSPQLASYRHEFAPKEDTK